MSATIEKYCRVHDQPVKIYRQPVAGATLLVCEHTFDREVFECKEKCAYAQGAQGAASMGVTMGMVALQHDGTVPISFFSTKGFQDFTRDLPKAETVAEKPQVPAEAHTVSADVHMGVSTLSKVLIGCAILAAIALFYWLALV